MADFDSKLPIQTLTNTDVTVQIRDSSANALNSTSGALHVSDAGGSLTVDAVDLDIRDLSHTQDSVKIGDGVDFLAINTGGSINAVVSATDLDIRDISHTQDSIKIGDGTDFMLVNADGSINSVVSATNLDIRDLSHTQDSVKIGDGTDFLAINADGSLNVVLTSTPAGDEINDYNTASAVAGGASSNHDYTVSAGKTLLLRQVESTASGKAKMEVRIETGVATGVFNTRFVQFNSSATPNMGIHLESPISVAAGVRVRVVRTNRDNQAQDLYSTISGQEV